MRTKQLSALCAVMLSVIAFASCSINQTKGDGNIVSNEVQISDYNNLELSGRVNIVYEQKKDTEPYLRIEVDENIFPLLDISSDNATLKIGVKSGENINPTKLDIYTNSTELAKVATSGSATIQMKGNLTGNDLKIHTSGSSNLRVDSLFYNYLEISMSGSGDIQLRGKVAKADFHTSGSSKIQAEEMMSDSVSCKISGSGNATVHAEKFLNIDISGSGKVAYKGSPHITQSISGSGKISQIN